MLTKPLLEAMKAYREDHVYPLHTPGHKGGRGADEDLKDLLGENALLSDVSLMEELDDIHHPEGAIKDAETLAATLYGADRCFLVSMARRASSMACSLARCVLGTRSWFPETAISLFGRSHSWRLRTDFPGSLL